MKIYVVTIRDRTAWCLDHGRVAGRRHREYYQTEKMARQAMRQRISDQAAGGRWWSMLSDAVKQDIISVAREADAAGVRLRDIWEAFAAARCKHPPSTRITLQEAIAGVLEAKQQANRRQRYLDGLAAYLAQFARGRELVWLDEIGPASIDEWFRLRKEPPSTRASNLGRLSALFGWAARRGYIADNPCARVERTRVESRAPEILTPAQACSVLEWVRANRPLCLQAIVLALLAGVRPEEVQQLSRADVDLQSGIVRIDAAGSKTRQRRLVHLEPAAIEWLRIAGRRSPAISRSTWRRCTRDLRRVLGLNKWPQDVLRHTCASYWLALTQDAGRVALELGHSPAILLRHYRELVARSEAERFWAILPASTRPSTTPKPAQRPP